MIFKLLCIRTNGDPFRGWGSTLALIRFFFFHQLNAHLYVQLCCPCLFLVITTILLSVFRLIFFILHATHTKARPPIKWNANRGLTFTLPSSDMRLTFCQTWSSKEKKKKQKPIRKFPTWHALSVSQRALNNRAIFGSVSFRTPLLWAQRGLPSVRP